jgi:glycerophosphoryl diester phosphodiesterase
MEVQAHRGARAVRPENTLPAFEAAIDAGADSIETDVHLTADGVPVLIHDPTLLDARFRACPDRPTAFDPKASRSIAALTLDEVRWILVDGNPDSARFPAQQALVSPFTQDFATARGLYPYGVPTLDDLFAFVADYASDLGREHGKSDQQRANAARLVFDLELKRLPSAPEAIGDGFVGKYPGLLEQRVVEAMRQAGVVARCRVRSFDHRAVRATRFLAPELERAILTVGIAPVDPVAMVRAADATTYCPDVRFLDESQVQICREAGIGVLPWTVNDPTAWARLIAWGVTGITTDDPAALRAFLDWQSVSCSATPS